jgi:ATP/maltotriose-dependent transcriptional regulator MalT
MELLERDDALYKLKAALKDAIAGQGRTMLVSGEAGIGKTALIERFTTLHGTSNRVLWGSCDALFTPRLLGSLHDIAAQTQGDLLTLLRAEASRTVLFNALLYELQQRPSIAVFEDVHWADEATLDLLKFLGRRIQRIPSMLILTYRDDEIGLRHPLRLLLGDLATSIATRRIALSPLSEEAVRHLIGNRALDAATLHRLSGGNPFFVTETIASGASGIPASVRDAVLARAARLSVSGRAVLEAAAVIGPRIELPLLAGIVGAEATAVEECMDRGMLIVQNETLAFRHELARQTILASISPPQKLVLHRLVLEALRSAPAAHNDVARLTYHAEAAGDREAVCQYAPAAARQAAAVSAHREAATQYALALRFAGNLPPPERALLLEAYAVACNMIDQRQEGISARRQALAIWRQSGNTLKTGENLAYLAMLLSLTGQNTEAEQASQEAIHTLEALEPSRELVLAYRVQASLRLFNSDHAEAIACGEKAIALAESLNDGEGSMLAHNAVGSAWLFLDYERGQAYLERRIAVARSSGPAHHVVNALNNLGAASGELYQLHDAERYLSEGIAWAIERDLDAMRFYMQAWLALTHLRLGRWSEAADMATAILQRPGVSAISRIMALVAIGRLRARRGDPGVAEALDEALVLANQTGHLQRLGPVYTACAEAAWLAGNHVQTLVETQAIYNQAVSKRHPWLTGELGFWRWRAGEQTPLPPWTAQPFAMQIKGEWRRAANEWEQLGCPYERAMALMDGDEAARRLALSIFEYLGAQPAVEKVHNILRPVPQRQLEREKFGGLSEREREVAVLIAQGKSNRQIAETMTVGVKTIETYVTRILNKLGFDSRVQIATWAVEKGLI